MLQFETDNTPDDLFNLFPQNELHECLWEIFQGWMIFLTLQEKDDMDIATRMYFYELSHLLSHQYKKGKKKKTIHPAAKCMRSVPNLSNSGSWKPSIPNAIITAYIGEIPDF
ncbi:hypothetical protein [Algoriphagus sp.]|uniref:hypothetical protein n=1 Tax=Algoriphagus sp. TaxID=1872435 RepID=UPI003F6FFB60